MGNGIIYYEIEKHKKYEDSNESVDSDFAIMKTRRYHFDDEPFIHPLHSVRFDPDRPYELPVESLLALRCRNPSKKKDPSPQESGQQGQEGARQLKSWELIPPSETWMYDGDDVEGKKASKEVLERVDGAKGIEEEDVDVDEDYLMYLEELRRHLEYSPVHSSQAFAQHPSDDTQSLSSDAHNQPSYDLFSVWPPPIGPSQ
ncbi:hypothetical protein PIB30_083962 [Stylosanthes scabra]|uniref:Uncharacterized protein n=1 Tax=Stylosanthes scabra TaxID=79078 RepID=A0ABU6XSK9_9FABA|nr:hypothetical protein [Stylosanthes scabra]